MTTMFWRTLAAFFAVLLTASPASAEWLRAESPNFVVYSESSENRIREQVAQLEGFDRLLRMLTNVDQPPAANKLHVYFVRGNAQLGRITRVGPSVGGFYRATTEGIVAAVDETINRGDNNNDVLFHEYAHHFMMQYAAAAYPGWYVEGFAEYVGTAEISPRLLTVGTYSDVRASWLADRNAWLPFDQIIGGLPARADDSDRARYYAQSWLLVHYLSSTDERRAGLRRYFAALRAGQQPLPTFQAVFGMDMRALDRALRDYSDRFTYMRIQRAATEPPPPVTVTPLTGYDDRLILAQAALRGGIFDEERQQALLEELRRAAARGDSAPARRLLAHAEILYGNAAAAEPVLDALLAASPQDAELLYLRGMRHLRAGRDAEDYEVQEAQFRLARPFFTRAHRADPNHFPTLYRYAESFRVEENYVSENIENILLLTSSLAPQVEEFRLVAADMLLKRGAFEEAETILAPIVTSAHGGGANAQAARLLARARARERTEGPAAEEADEEAAAPAGE